LAEITDKDSRLVTATIKLNEQQIFNLDFGRFIYIDGILYRIQRIIDYTAGELCKVELLRVIYTSYGNELNPYEKYIKITLADNIYSEYLKTESLNQWSNLITGQDDKFTSYKLNIIDENTFEVYLYGVIDLYSNIDINTDNGFTANIIRFEDKGLIKGTTSSEGFYEFLICSYLDLPLIKDFNLFCFETLGGLINDLIIKIPSLEANALIFNNVIGKNIELTIPSNMVADTYIQNLIDNNNVTIFEV
jgi:hypothetical protein